MRVESSDLVVGYEFDLKSNEILARTIPNPSAGKEHTFVAYRTKTDSNKSVVGLTVVSQDSIQTCEDEDE